MPLHTHKPNEDLISKYFKSFNDEEIEGYMHILKVATFDDMQAVLDDFKPYFESAHLDARSVFHVEVGINLHPDAGIDDPVASISYPRTLPIRTRRGLFGEAFSGLLTELVPFIGKHNWQIPVFLFRFHAEIGAYLYTLRRDPSREREVHGRKGDDFIAIVLDENKTVVRVLSGEAKWRTKLQQSVVNNLLYGDKKTDPETGKLKHNGNGIINSLNQAVDPPHGLKQIQQILSAIAPDEYADTIVSIDEAVTAEQSNIECTNLIVLAGNRPPTLEDDGCLAPHDEKPDGYTSDRDLQIVEVLFESGEILTDALYDSLFEEE